MTKSQASLIAGFLQRALDEQGNSSCNDFYLQDTLDNRELAERADRQGDGDGTSFQASNGKILTYDFMILGELRQQFMREQEITEEDVASLQITF